MRFEERRSLEAARHRGLAEEHHMVVVAVDAVHMVEQVGVLHTVAVGIGPVGVLRTVVAVEGNLAAAGDILAAVDMDYVMERRRKVAVVEVDIPGVGLVVGDILPVAHNLVVGLESRHNPAAVNNPVAGILAVEVADILLL